MKNKKSENLLDKIPCLNTKHEAKIGDDGMVTIFVENKGPFNFVAQKLLKKPRFSQVHLEKFGSFIWQQIDGTRTVEEIGKQLQAKFGAEADPLYPRIAMYLKSLKDYDFISYK